MNIRLEKHRPDALGLSPMWRGNLIGTYKLIRDEDEKEGFRKALDAIGYEIVEE